MRKYAISDAAGVLNFNSSALGCSEGKSN